MKGRQGQPPWSATDTLPCRERPLQHHEVVDVDEFAGEGVAELLP